MFLHNNFALFSLIISQYCLCSYLQFFIFLSNSLPCGATIDNNTSSPWEQNKKVIFHLTNTNII